MVFKVLYLYPNFNYIYNHNIILKVLSNKLKIKNINMIIDTYTIGDPSLELSEYDLVFMGIYNLREKTIIVNDLKKHINKIKRFMFDKTLFLIYDDFFYLCCFGNFFFLWYFFFQ